ncbi:MAG: hypothetical protein WBK55_01400 [Alphaproteobacteria bacterium]
MGAAKLQSCVFSSREAFTALMLAALLLVTGCGSSDNYTPNAALAPPPPFMVSIQSYGPPVPAEIAMVRMMNSIMPAAGEGFPSAELPANVPARKCFTSPAFNSNEGNIGFGFGGPSSHDSEYRFSGLHSGGQMTVQLTFALPSPVRRSVSCR